MVEGVDELYENIHIDKEKIESHDRYPVRFIFLPLSKGLSPYLISLASRLSCNVKKISDYFPEDKWVTWETIYERIEKEIYSSNRDIIFFGLSEYLRFTSKKQLESVFINLIGIENNIINKKNKRRIYFIMDSFEKNFTKYVLDNHHRSSFYDPIIRGSNNSLISGDNPKLAISMVFSGEYNKISSVKQYLDMQTKSDYFEYDKWIYCSSKTIHNLAINNQDFLEDAFFCYKIIDNKYPILIEKVIGLVLTEKYYKDNDFMDWLSDEISLESNVISLEDFLKIKLKINCISFDSLLYKYFSSNKNEQKLILLSLEIFATNDRLFALLNYLFSNYNITSKNNFIETLYLCDDLFIKDVVFEERKKLLTFIAKKEGEIEAPAGLIELYSSVLKKIIRENVYLEPNYTISIKTDFLSFLKEKGLDDDKIKYIFQTYKNEFIYKFLTSNSMLEKRIIIMLVSNDVFNDDDLNNYYSELYGYLSYKSSCHNVDELDEYFYQYKKSKIANKPTDYLKNYMMQMTSGNFLSFYNQNSYKNIDDRIKAKYIFVLDGVGAEYLSLITFYLENLYGKNVKIAEYRKALLPTITETNKQLINLLTPNPIWMQEFDAEIIHGDFYSPEKNLEKSLSLLKMMVGKIVEKVGEDSFMIIADHGSTVSHKIFKASKKYDIFPNAEHDGRCCKDFNSNIPDDSNDYVKYIDREGKEWVIAINYSSLNNTGKYESHGGGTIEEIFVPYVYCGIEGDFISFNINVVKKQVSGIDRTIKFTITPQIAANDVQIVEETGVVSTPYISDGLYVCNLSVGKTQNITIKINDYKEIVKVTNSSGINSREGGFF